MIYTVIAKPTKACNADCSYCCAPPDDINAWSFEDFKLYFDKLAPHLSEQANIIWHGGEPMLMGPDFYRQCWAYAKSIKPEIKFSIQTNILLYKTSLWKDVFWEIMGGRISTSFDPDEENRTIKGSKEKYSKTFYRKIEEVINDGFSPMVIGTYNQVSWLMAEHMYDFSKSFGDKAFPLRFNYRYPAGRNEGLGEMITPETYGNLLIGLYDRWITELPDFTVTPLDQMLLKVAGSEGQRCPWTANCGGHFLGLEPSGDVYNCSEFADLGDDYVFGNLREKTVPELLSSKPAVEIRRRPVILPMDCKACRHFEECEGGCARDAVLYGKGIGGKFHYCDSWKMTFDRIKESVLSGEADGALEKFGLNVDDVKRQVKARMNQFKLRIA